MNDKPVAFIAVLPLPSGNIDKMRLELLGLVVLPDFQGLGIGVKILNVYMASMYYKDNKTLYIKTSNPCFIYEV